MKKKTCVHPRRAYNLMKNFLNNACTLEHTYMYRTLLNPHDKPTEWRFSDYIEDFESITINLHKGDYFCAESVDTVEDAEEGVLNIYYNFNELNDEGAKLFRSHWTVKNPMLKGFANITLVLLHELGHLETTDEIRSTFSYFDREMTLIKLNQQYQDYTSLNNAYFDMPDESAATNWGIKWLSNPENRKIAKAFEKKFFACFE